MIKISEKFRGKDYFHADQKLTFDRIKGGIGWPGELEGAVVILGEATLHDTVHRFVLAEAYFQNYGDLTSAVMKLQQELDVSEWYGRHVPGSEEYLSIFNRGAFNKGKPSLNITDPPGVDDRLQFQVELIKDSVKADDKRLHFFEDSSLPAVLQGLPTKLYMLTNLENPPVAALGAVLSSLEEFPARSGYVERPSAPY